jgi:hypothetical protein
MQARAAGSADFIFFLQFASAFNVEPGRTAFKPGREISVLNAEDAGRRH